LYVACIISSNDFELTNLICKLEGNGDILQKKTLNAVSIPTGMCWLRKKIKRVRPRSCILKIHCEIDLGVFFLFKIHFICTFIHVMENSVKIFQCFVSTLFTLSTRKSIA